MPQISITVVVGPHAHPCCLIVLWYQPAAHSSMIEFALVVCSVCSFSAPILIVSSLSAPVPLFHHAAHVLYNPLCKTKYFYLIIFIHHFYFPALWTSRGHRCPTGVFLSPPQCRHPFVFIAERVQHPLLVDFHRNLLTHALALSAMRKGT